MKIEIKPNKNTSMIDIYLNGSLNCQVGDIATAAKACARLVENYESSINA